LACKGGNLSSQTVASEKENGENKRERTREREGRRIRELKGE
jgi:hypothetical protein